MTKPETRLRFFPLQRNALFISMELSVPRAAWLLPRGLLVSPIPNAESPVTGKTNELRVSAPDVVGRVWRGWVAARTKLGPEAKKYREPKPGERPQAYAEDRDMSLSAWDRLRERVVRQPPRNGVTKDGAALTPWLILTWLARYGLKVPNVLAKVAREFGEAPKRDVEARARQVAQLVLGEEISEHKFTKIRRRLKKEETARLAAAQQATTQRSPVKEIPMSKSAKKSSKASAKKSATPKPRARSAGKTAGETLVQLGVKFGGMAEKLAQGGTFTAPQLGKLRDAVNEAATKARTAGKNAVASKLSGANRLVRRLERAAR